VSRFSVLLLASDERGLAEHALPAALAAGPDEALVVDNGSRDGVAELAARHGVECLRLARRVPYTHAMNAGLRRVSGDAVALLQADTFVGAGYRAVTEAALADPAVGAVAPRLVRALGPAPAQRLEELDAAGMSLDRRRKNGLVGHGRPAADFVTPSEVFGADGAAAVYRRAALEDCALPGGQYLDEEMPGWGCDADLAWRARLRGWRAVYAPDAVVHHVRTYSPTTRDRMSEADRRVQFRNRYLMMVKNDSAADLLRDAPRILGYEALALGHALLRERHLLRAYGEAWRRLPAARRRRRAVQAGRRVRRVPFGLEAPQGTAGPREPAAPA